MSVRQWDLDPLPRAEAGRPAPVIRVSLGAGGSSATETGEAAEPAAGRAQQGRELGSSHFPLSAWPELESEAGGSCRGRRWNPAVRQKAGDRRLPGLHIKAAL